MCLVTDVGQDQSLAFMPWHITTTVDFDERDFFFKTISLSKED